MDRSNMHKMGQVSRLLELRVASLAKDTICFCQIPARVRVARSYS